MGAMQTNTIIKEFLKRPIAYQPILGKAFGSINLGILWSQLYYWRDKGSDQEGWIYKNQADIYDETGLSRREQETARKIGRQLRVLEERVSGQPPTVHFRIDEDRALEVINHYLLERERGQLKLIPETKPDKNTSSIGYLKNIPADDLKELSNKYEVDEKFILARAEDVIDYCEAKGRAYKDYKAALRNFIKSEIRRHPDERNAFRDKRRKEAEDEIRRLEEKANQQTPEQRARTREQVAQIKKMLAGKMKWPKAEGARA